MAFPSSSGTTQDSQALAWDRARSIAASVKQRAQSLRTASADGAISAGLVLDLATAFADMRIGLQRSAAVGGIAAYAQAQVANPALDVAAEFSAMVARIDATTAWVIANFPKDAGGFLLHVAFAADNSGRTQFRQLTTAQTAGLRTVLDALIATID